MPIQVILTPTFLFSKISTDRILSCDMSGITDTSETSDTLKELWRNITVRRLGKEFVCKRTILVREFM